MSGKVASGTASLRGAFLYGRSSGKESANRFAVDGKWENSPKGKFSWVLTCGYSRDRFSGFRFRSYLGPGVGYSVLKGELQELQFFLALNYYYDRYSLGAKLDDSYFSGKLTGKYEWQAQKNLKLRENFNYLVSFREGRKFFFDSETAVEVKINKTLSIGLSLKLNYQHHPPAPELKKLDTTFLTSLVIDIR